MTNSHRTFAPQGRNWLERVLYALLGLTVLVLAFFFLTVALVAGALLAAVIAVRWWWLARKLRQRADEGTLEGEYTVVEQPLRQPGRNPPTLPRDR